jgi:hypothetical protein
MADVHKPREHRKDKFCAVAADGLCGCEGAGGNKDYTKECEPIEDWKPEHDFTWNNKNNKPRQQGHAPHHIVCIQSVGLLVIYATDKKIEPTVRATVWCANNAKNMIAMPLWGHTVKWYCNVKEGTLRSSKRGEPPFANIPQHDWDHTGIGCYIAELDIEINKLVKNMKSVGHKIPEDGVKKQLDVLSDKFRKHLTDRGSGITRSNKIGTHDAWKGSKNPSAKWYLPFSMADEPAASRKSCPKLDFDAKFKRKLKWLANQL